MKKQLISKTNPYLRDRTKRQVGLIATVRSSSAIEGITSADRVLAAYLKKNNTVTRRTPEATD